MDLGNRCLETRRKNILTISIVTLEEGERKSEPGREPHHLLMERYWEDSFSIAEKAFWFGFPDLFEYLVDAFVLNKSAGK